MIAAASAGLALVGLVYLAFAHWATRRHFAAGPPPPRDTGHAVSILKPIEGATEATLEALRSFLDVAWDGPVELLVGTLRPDDPVVGLVERLRAERPEANLRLVLAEPLGANRKTSIMAALAREAAGELLFFSDADVRVQPGYLRRLAPLVADPEVGCVTCLPRPVGAATLGGALVALHYATVYLPQWMSATRTTGIRFAIGMTMALRREVLERIGGFAPFADALADDFELGRRAADLGLRVALPALLLDTRMPHEGPRAAWRRLLRWKRTIRRCRPRHYAGTLVCGPLPFALLAALAEPAAWSLGLLGVTLLARLAQAAHVLACVARVDGWARLLPLVPLLDLLELGTYLTSYLGHTVEWAGRRYRLGRDGSLSPLESVGAAGN